MGRKYVNMLSIDLASSHIHTELSDYLQMSLF